MRITRRAIQGLFLVLFLFLFIRTESTGENELGYPVRIFLDFDPLLLVSTLLSTHTLKAGFIYALVLVLVTVLLGRVFCGWICPMGTLHDCVGFCAAGKQRKADDRRWFGLKYLVLFFILAASVGTVQVAGVMDPLSLLVRSLTVGVWPALQWGIRSFFEGMYELDLPGMTSLSEALYGILRDRVLSFHQPYFMQGFPVSAVFIIILALNVVRRRFWCRYLCPLGALLGLLSRRAFIRRSVSEGCTSCGVCSQICPSGAAVPGGQSNPAECLVCLECDDPCPAGAVSFGFRCSPGQYAPLDLGRRAVITSMAGGIAVVPFLRINPVSNPGTPPAALIRPPGALRERDFLRSCVRCGECMKVCITNGLQPTLLQAGLEGIWTPLLVPRIGHCEFRCTLCGQVCPTGAIKKFTMEEKETVRIGMAVIDRGRCLPWANGLQCSVCEEVCPTPSKTIHLEEGIWVDREGNEIRLKQPVVDLERCVGCGACEYHCPVAGKPAIYVISTGESRSGDNRALL